MKTLEVPKWTFYLMIVMILSMLLIFFLANQDGNKCISNPLVYGAQKALDTSGGDIYCACEFTEPKYEPFYFNDKEVRIESWVIG